MRAVGTLGLVDWADGLCQLIPDGVHGVERAHGLLEDHADVIGEQFSKSIKLLDKNDKNKVQELI